MQLIAIGTGYISSEITKGVKKKANGEEIFVCFFQFANYNYCDPETRKNVYSKYLCEVVGNYGKIIYENFTKGQKIFIFGKETNQRIKDKNTGKLKNITLLHLEKVEFMANTKEASYDTKEPSATIDDIMDNENVAINEVSDINSEIFT